MAPYIKRRTANALMQMGSEANASPRDPLLPKDAVPLADRQQNRNSLRSKRSWANDGLPLLRRFLHCGPSRS